MEQFIKDDMLDDKRLFKIHHNISTSWTMKQFHFHDEFEINISISGGNRFFINNKIYNVNKGDLFLFNTKDLHKNVVPPNIKYERYLIFFKPKVIKDLCTKETNLLELFTDRKKDFHNKISLEPKQIIQIVLLLKSSIYYQEHNVYGSDVYQRLKLIEILLLINSYYKSYDIERNTFSSVEYERIKPILLFIDKNLQQKLQLDDLAAKFYISKYYLCEIFKKTTGFTVNEYITNKRIFEARELLLKGMSVSRVGEIVGYQNDSHFIRTFKKLVGQTPKQYSKKNKNKL